MTGNGQFRGRNVTRLDALYMEKEELKVSLYSVWRQRQELEQSCAWLDTALRRIDAMSPLSPSLSEMKGDMEAQRSALERRMAALEKSMAALSDRYVTNARQIAERIECEKQLPPRPAGAAARPGKNQKERKSAPRGVWRAGKRASAVFRVALLFLFWRR